MQIGKCDASSAGGAAESLHARIERNQSLCEIPRVGRDAVLTRPEDGVLPVDPLESRTPGPGCTLVAWPGSLPVVLAPGTLQDIAAQGRHVADLARRGEHQSVADERIA